MWAVIPVKKINNAKCRLKSVLSPFQRSEFFAMMLEDVLSILKNIPEIENVSLATVCTKALKIAKKYDASILNTHSDEGQTSAITKSATALEQNGVKKMLMLPGDIPLVNENEISKVINVHKSAPTMTIVPARDRKGSNCVALSPPTAMPLSFGPNSYFPHLEMARSLGLKINSIPLSGIGLDIDTPADLKELCKKPILTKAQNFLNEQNILEKILNKV